MLFVIGPASLEMFFVIYLGEALRPRLGPPGGPCPDHFSGFDHLHWWSVLQNLPRVPTRPRPRVVGTLNLYLYSGTEPWTDVYKCPTCHPKSFLTVILSRLREWDDLPQSYASHHLPQYPYHAKSDFSKTISVIQPDMTYLLKVNVTEDRKSRALRTLRHCPFAHVPEGIISRIQEGQDAHVGIGMTVGNHPALNELDSATAASILHVDG